MKPLTILACAASIMLASCSFGSYSYVTAENVSFPIDKVQLGGNCPNVIATCGKPFMTDKYTENGKNIIVFHYKEIVYLNGYPYEVNTQLFFENNSLISIKQSDVRIVNTNINVNSEKKQQ